VSACGSSNNDAPDADAVAAVDGAGEPGAASNTVDASDGGGDSQPPFSLGLAPPAVDCSPYAGLASCALRVAPGPAAAAADGLAWATAFSSVQEALDRAPCGCEVWIASGIYLPTMSLDPPGGTTDSRDLSFVLWPGARVLGGFAGIEADPGARAPGHETVLSGDLGVKGSTDDNAYHVVVGADGATIDGLTIRGGESNGFGAGEGVGAGVFAFSADMTLSNLVISDNDADSGAGFYSDEHSRPHVVGCTFARNTANDGGGMVAVGDSAVVERSVFEDGVGIFSGPAITDFAGTMTVTDTHFLRNRGDSGGAVTVSGGTGSFERCWFEGNEAGSFGGAMLVRFGATARLSSTVLVSNGSVGFGGALAVWTATLDVEAATIVDNVAAIGGAFLVKDGSTFTLSDSVVWRNPDDQGLSYDLDGMASTISVTTCDEPPEVPEMSSFDEDPRLTNAPLATRFAVEAGAVDNLPVTGADQVFASGDRIELGNDGVERKVTAVNGDNISFSPPLLAPAPRFMRIDLWSADAPSLNLDLTPLAGSPLIDAASSSAPALDVDGHPRTGAPDIGALEAP
jgi:hypothetical protein